MILAGDIGGTHTRLALFEKSGSYSLVTEMKYKSREYDSLEAIIHQFLAEKKKKVVSACIGIAGPVRSGISQATNLAWMVDSKRLADVLGLSEVHLLNDLEANAYGTKVLKDSEIAVLHPGQKQKGNQALIAAGTGLGEAGIYWDGVDHRPFATEGGHADFAPRNKLEIDLLLFLKKKFGHVSYERVVSGPGLYSIYQFLIESGREAASPEVDEAILNTDPPRVISEYSSKDKACSAATDCFLSLYGAEAGNMALKFLAIGGMYVGGGIAPILFERMKKGAFHSAFVDKGRFTDLLHSIPIYVIMNDNAALLGAAYYARNQMEGNRP